MSQMTIALKLHHDGLSKPLERPLLRALSLGAGVQSTVLALAAARGEIGPMPDCAFFSDTGDEPAAVYRHLDWLEGQLPFEVVRIQQPRSLSAALMAGDDLARIPAFVGAGGLATRQCTRNWKIRPIRRAVRERLGVGPRGYLAPDSVEMWIGISMDEIVRMKRSGSAYLYNRHPLIEARMSRRDCVRWLMERQYPIPPKSACRYCPYTDNPRWLAMREDQPEEFELACQMDRWLREPAQVKRFRGELYIHHSRRPLQAADLTAPSPSGFDFGNECEGMCGV